MNREGAKLILKTWVECPVCFGNQNCPKDEERHCKAWCWSQNEVKEAVGVMLNDNKVTGWIPVSERLPEPEKEVEVTAERHWSCSGEDKKIYLTCRAIYENGTIWREDSSFGWENFDNYEYDEERDDWKIPEGWFEYVTYGEESAAIDDFVIAWREIGEPYKAE